MRPTSFTQSGCDPKMMESCIVVSPNANTVKTRIGYAVEAPDEPETPRARFIRELIEKRRSK